MRSLVGDVSQDDGRLVGRAAGSPGNECDRAGRTTGRAACCATSHPRWNGLLIAFLLCLCGGALQAATLALTNADATGTGAYAVTTSSGALLPASAHAALGRFTLSETDLQNALAANNIAAVEAAWQGFGAGFPLNGFGAPGRLDAVAHGDTRPSASALGGEAVWLWISDQTSRTASTQHLIVRLDAVFPTDSETLPPAGPVALALRPDRIAKVMIGGVSAATHDFGFGSGPLVTLRLGNAPPVAQAAAFQTDEDVLLQGNLSATDANNDPLTFSIASEPSQGSVTLTPGIGAFSYQPTANYHGADSFSFTVTDGMSVSNEAVVSLTIHSVPDVPVAFDQSFNVSAGVPFQGQLQAVDGDDDPLVFSVVSGPLKVALNLANDGSFTFTPTAGEVGADSFTFKVNDGTFDSNVATVSLEIIPNLAPVAEAAVFRTDEGDLLTGLVSASDANDDPLTFALQNAASHGTVSLEPSGAFRYRPQAGYLGLDSFSFTASDGALSSEPAIVTVVVRPRTPRWTWKHGPSKPRQKSILTGDEITPAARMDAASAVDSSGWVWMYGGSGPAALSDLWRYDAAGNGWTAFTPSDANPGARSGAAMWRAQDDTLWLFGGSATLDDLWRYDPAQNAWQAQTVTGAKPSPRTHAMRWQDAAGRFWLFGGKGKKPFDDLWSFDPQSGAWTQVSAPVKPSARSRAAAWVDKDDALWLFGGQGAKSALNDLWKFDPLRGKWTQTATGTPLKARSDALAWTQPDGRFIIGFGAGDDVWRYDPASTAWELLKGRVKPNGAAVHGVKNTPDRRNTPGHRGGGIVLGESSSGRRIFGGGKGSSVWSDTWEFDPGLTPVVQIERVHSITEDAAEVAMTVDDGGIPLQSVTLRCWPAGNPEQAQTASGTTLTGLAAGTWHEVEAVAVSDIGASRSGIVRFRTSGASAVQPQWTDAGPTTVSEDQGLVALQIDLGTAADSVQELAFDYTGSTASAPGDVLALPSTLRVPAGQRFAKLLLHIVDDQEQEGSENLLISLNGGTPHEVIITDNDGPAHIDTPPASQIIASGSKAVFQVTASGTPPLKYQWKKDGVNLKGATKPTLTATKPGSYTVEVAGALGLPVLSTPADLGVVVVKNETRTLAANAGTILSVTATGPALSFAWEKDGLPTGETSASLSLSNAGPADSGSYRCRVSHTQAADFLAGVITLRVVGDVPQISRATLPEGTVGTPYLHQIQIENLPAGAPASITVKGLPSGLKCSASGLISGIPKAATAQPKSVTIQARNLAGAALAVDTSITIRPVPQDYLGRYIGLVERDAGQADGLGGLLDIKTTAKGSFTAKLSLGTRSWSDKGPLQVTTGAVAALVMGGHQVQFALTDQGISGSVDGVPVDGVKQASAGLTGTYHFLLKSSPDTFDDIDLPQGQGWGRVVLSASGLPSISGIAADGLPFVCASITSADGWVPLYSANTGSLHGEVWLNAQNADGELTWKRLPSAKARAYRSGFEAQPLTVWGGRYTAPAAGEVLMHLPNTGDNARLVFAEGGLPEGTPAPLIFSIRNLKPAAAKQTVVLPSHNPDKVKFTLNKPVPGGFRGAFSLADKRSATYTGLIIQRAGEHEAAGHFLMPQIPEPGQTPSTSDLLSGEVILEANTP